MKRHSLRRWLAACMFGASYLSGSVQFQAPAALAAQWGEPIAGVAGAPAPVWPARVTPYATATVVPARVTPYATTTVVPASVNVPAGSTGWAGNWPPAHRIVPAVQAAPVVTASPSPEPPLAQPAALAPAARPAAPVISPAPLPSANDLAGVVAVTTSVRPDSAGNLSPVREALQLNQPRPILQFQEMADPDQTRVVGPPQEGPPAKISWQEPASVFPRGDTGPGRRSFVDLSASPCFGHAPDYRWIDGQVEYSRIGKEWRLRYASVDETDRFGGRVLLIENRHVSLLADGQYVHVEGHLVNPDADRGLVSYRIESFRTIRDPNSAGAAGTATEGRIAPMAAPAAAGGGPGEGF